MRFSIMNLPRNRIKRIQFRKIKHVVTYAYQNSSFYHDYYKSNGFHPSMLKEYDDIGKIPIVKRSMLKNAPTESVLTTKNLKKLHLHTTSGSSGTPLKFYYTALENLKKNYGVLRAYLMMGVKLTDTTVALRDPIDITKPTLYQKMGIIPYDYCNIYTPISEIYEYLCEKYETIDVLKGMPSDLLNLSYTVRNGNKKFPKVKKIISDSEVLDDFSRQYITETFGKEIQDFYGSVENGCIAFQLEGSNKYYLNEDQILLENGTPDENPGDVIITNLRNKTFPIIRYQIGDMVTFGNGKSDLTEKGVNLRTIEKIHGKYLDFIVLPDHTIISPHVPKQEITHLDGIKKFQIIQTDYNLVNVKIEKDIGYSERTEEKIIDALENAFHNQIKVSVEYDDELSIKTKNKFKCIQSFVSQDFLSKKYEE